MKFLHSIVVASAAMLIAACNPELSREIFTPSEAELRRATSLLRSEYGIKEIGRYYGVRVIREEGESRNICIEPGNGDGTRIAYSIKNDKLFVVRPGSQPRYTPSLGQNSQLAINYSIINSQQHNETSGVISSMCRQG